jgi:hypothetical protein
MMFPHKVMGVIMMWLEGRGGKGRGLYTISAHSKTLIIARSALMVTLVLL